MSPSLKRRPEPEPVPQPVAARPVEFLDHNINADGSPALALQDALRTALSTPQARTILGQTADQDRPWSPRRKLAVLVGSSALLWIGIFAAARALFG